MIERDALRSGLSTLSGSPKGRSPADVHHGAAEAFDGGRIEDVELDLVQSADPMVVLSSVARASIGWFSDVCVLEVIAGDEPTFTVSYPLEENAVFSATEPRDANPSGRTAVGLLGSVRTPFQASATLGYPPFAGVLWHGWTSRRTTGQDAAIARLLAERGMSAVALCREQERAQTADATATRLSTDLLSSMVIGEAAGVIMGRNGVDRDEAHSWLRSASFRSQRQIEDIAAAVVHDSGYVSVVGTDPHVARAQTSLRSVT